VKHPGFLYVDERLARLSGLGNQLEAFFRTADFKVLRPDWELALAYSYGVSDQRSSGGFEKPSGFAAFSVIPFLLH